MPRDEQAPVTGPFKPKGCADEFAMLVVNTIGYATAIGMIFLAGVLYALGY